MKKIPTVFKRNPDDRAHVLPEVNPGCEWVLAGEGQATRKYDGTCVMLDDGGEWWARREVKAGKTPPPNFRIEEYDQATGKSVGWEPMARSPFAKFHAEALEPLIEFGWLTHLKMPAGTFELIGPKINGNPEKADRHRLERHSTAETWANEDVLPTGLDTLGALAQLRDFILALHEHEGWEGIVWHHPGGRMAKLKARDFA